MKVRQTKDAVPSPFLQSWEKTVPAEDCIPLVSLPTGPRLLAGWVLKSSLSLGWKEGRGRKHLEGLRCLHDKCQRPEAIYLGALVTSVTLRGK